MKNLWVVHQRIIYIEDRVRFLWILRMIGVSFQRLLIKQCYRIYIYNCQIYFKNKTIIYNKNQQQQQLIILQKKVINLIKQIYYILTNLQLQKIYKKMKQQQQNKQYNSLQNNKKYQQNKNNRRSLNIYMNQQQVGNYQENVKNYGTNINHLRIGSIKKNLNKIQDRDRQDKGFQFGNLVQSRDRHQRSESNKQQNTNRYSLNNIQKAVVTNIDKTINTSDYNPKTQFTNFHKFNTHQLISRPTYQSQPFQKINKKILQQNHKLNSVTQHSSNPNLNIKQKQIYKYQQNKNTNTNQKQREQINKYFNNQSDNQEQHQYIGGEQIQIDVWNRKNNQQQNFKEIAMQKSKQKQRKKIDIMQKYGKKQQKEDYSQQLGKKYRQQEFSKKLQFQDQDEDQDEDYDYNYNKFKDVISQNVPNINVYKQQKTKNINNVNKNIQINPSNSLKNKPYQYSNAQSYSSQFIDSRHQNSNHKKIYKQPKYGPGGLQTLQFNTQKQKIIILDSKQTQRMNANLPNLLKSFCQDIQIPILQKLPTYDNTPQQLIIIAKDCFSKFGCSFNDQTVISVKKYKNCVHFSISNEYNILYHYDHGKLYYGAWKAFGNNQGQKHGEGIQILPTRYKFKGFFVEGKKSGFGTLINFDGSAYVGQWQNGCKHGQGKFIDTQGILYQGEWKQGKKSGYGKIINNDRLQFQGVFIKGLKNGYGKQYFENGDTYDGNFINHKFSGKGTYRWKSGAQYTGEFKNGKRNGYGVWKSAQNNFDIYEGQYLDDRKSGVGIYKWANGSIYEGEFKDDLKHGNGTIQYENGKIAHLVWKNGKAQRKLQGLPKQKINRYQDYQDQLQFSQRKYLKKGNQINEPLLKQKSSNFILRSRPTSRSTQNLTSAHSISTVNSNNFARGITFHTRSANKLSKPSQTNKHSYKKDGQKIIRLKFDNNQFQKALGKHFNKNIIGKNKVKQQKKLKPDMPRDRPYQGIQFTSNININM